MLLHCFNVIFTHCSNVKMPHCFNKMFLHCLNVIPPHCFNAIFLCCLNVILPHCFFIVFIKKNFFQTTFLLSVFSFLPGHPTCEHTNTFLFYYKYQGADGITTSSYISRSIMSRSLYRLGHGRYATIM